MASRSSRWAASSCTKVTGSGAARGAACSPSASPPASRADSPIRRSRREPRPPPPRGLSASASTLAKLSSPAMKRARRSRPPTPRHNGDCRRHWPPSALALSALTRGVTRAPAQPPRPAVAPEDAVGAAGRTGSRNGPCPSSALHRGPCLRHQKATTCRQRAPPAPAPTPPPPQLARASPPPPPPLGRAASRERARPVRWRARWSSQPAAAARAPAYRNHGGCLVPDSARLSACPSPRVWARWSPLGFLFQTAEGERRAELAICTRCGLK